jgi:hypothetical protein
VEVFDEDLWRRGKPGEDEAFDAARFVVWLEILVEAGAAVAARRLTELPEDLVVHALHQHVLVIDMDALAEEMSVPGDDDLVEKALESCLYQELENFRVMARKSDGWDAIVAALVAMDEQHHDVLMRILERGAYLSEKDIRDGGGLYDVLTSEDSLAADVAGEREDRRARDGFVAPSSARAFLRLAAQTPLDAARGQPRDAVTRAYFRELAPRPADEASAGRLARLLRDAGVLDGAAPRQAKLTAGPMPAEESAFRDALAALLERDPAKHAQRMAELGYLANVMVAGADGGGGRTFRPAEAAAAVVATCAIGMALLAGDPVDVVEREPADTLFRLGWRILHERTGDPARALLRDQISVGSATGG